MLLCSCWCFPMLRGNLAPFLVRNAIKKEAAPAISTAFRPYLALNAPLGSNRSASAVLGTNWTQAVLRASVDLR